MIGLAWYDVVIRDMACYDVTVKAVTWDGVLVERLPI